MTQNTHFDPAGDPADKGHAPATLGGTEETYVFPASLEQNRYWTLAQLDPQSTASNMAISFEIEGALDPSLVERTLSALTMRHEALRTIFRLVNGTLSQIILARPLYGFSIADLSHLSSEGRETALGEQLTAHSHVHIDLYHGPVIVARLLRLTSTHHVLAFTMSHIVCDGWSNGILVRDFAILYEALRDGCEAQLPDLPFQFADFSTWQSQFLESGRATAALEFWKSHVRRDLPAVDMPADSPRTAGRSFPGHIESVLMPRELEQRLAAYCRSSGSTKHIVLMAAFQALCARYTGQPLFLLGSTIANRTQPGMEDVLGRFANPQILVADVQGDPSFRELESRVREWETTAYTHQDLPFSRIIEEFQMNQAGAASQFLQVWFLYQKAFMRPQVGSAIRITPRRSLSGGVDFDMLVSVVERDEGPRIQVEYNTDLFSKRRIQDLIYAYQGLLAHALRLPEARVSALELGRRNEHLLKLQVGETASAGVVEEPISLLAALREHAVTRPHQIAVVSGANPDESLTWQELDERSDTLKQELALRGVDENSRVLVCLAPTVNTLIAVLAALKLRAEILPLPAYADAAQIQYAAEAAGVNLILAPRTLIGTSALGFAFEAIPATPEFKTALPPSTRDLSEQDADESVGRESAHWLSTRTSAEGALTFVSVPLSETLAAVKRTRAALRISSLDSLLSFSPPSPQDAWADLLLALITGGRLTVCSAATVGDVQSLLDRERITLLSATPGELRNWQLSGWKGDRRVGVIMRGGRLSSAALREPIQSVRGAWSLLSNPERGEWIGTADLQLSDSSQFQPFPGVALSVLDEAGQFVPTGVSGELATALGGRTGLLAQVESSGRFRISDRKDRVVQLHGHRFRLGEVEDALLREADVLDVVAAVVTAPEADQNKVLIAYVIGAAAIDDGSTLRKRLTATLPSHLLPEEILLVDAWPRQLDGTIELRRLPQLTAPNVAESTSAEEGVHTDGIEDRLTTLWKEVLSLRTLDRQASFFELGGNSLLLVRLFARINKAFGTSLPITTIFDAETVQQLAATLRKQTEIRPLVLVQPNGKKRPLFMIHSYLLYQGLSTSLGDDQPFYGLRELERDGDLNIEQRAARYVDEIRKVQPTGPYAIAGWCAAGPLTTEVARQLVESGNKMTAVVLFDSWLPGYMESLESQQNRSFAPKTSVLRRKFAYKLEKMRDLSVGQKLRFVRTSVGRIVREGRDRLFIRHWARLNWLSSRFHFPLPQFMYNTSLQTFAALQDFREQKMPIQLTLIRASDAREIEGASVSCGWERVAEGGVQVLWAPGDHETMFLGANLQTTAEMVQGCLSAPPAPVVSPVIAHTSVPMHSDRMAEVGSF